MILWLAIWLAVAVFVVARAHARRSVGLVAAYMGNLWIIHWLGASAYVFDGWRRVNDPNQVARGFELCTYGVLALAVGLEMRYRRERPPADTPPDAIGTRDLESFTKFGMVVGFISYFVLLPVLGGVATLTAVISCGLSLFTTCVTLRAWSEWRAGRQRQALRWGSVLAILPLLTVAAQGFLGYGTLNLVTALALLVREVKRRAVAIGLATLMAYAGLSFYVSYMRDRSEIRSVVWGGRDLFDRVESIGGTFLATEPFDWTDPAHLRRLDERLNQNALVGAADEYLSAGRTSYAHGGTLLQALTSLIPRALWPDKPFGAGSMNIVTEYTGIRFARNTSVGVGVVLELFINFGTAGVAAGMFFIGYLLGALDRRAASRLEAKDWRGFLLVYLPSLSLLQVGGMFLEITAAAAGSYLLARVVITLHARRRLRPMVAPGPGTT